jgi:hypothetical protein
VLPGDGAFIFVMRFRYRSQHESERDAAMKQFEAFKKAAAAKQSKMKEEFDDKLQSMMEQSKAALKDFQDKTKSFADVIARLENQVMPRAAVLSLR